MADRRDEARARRRHVPIRVDSALHDRLAVEADARGLAVTFLVAKLLEESLERLIPAAEFSLTRPGGGS